MLKEFDVTKVKIEDIKVHGSLMEQVDKYIADLRQRVDNIENYIKNNNEFHCSNCCKSTIVEI